MNFAGFSTFGLLFSQDQIDFKHWEVMKSRDSILIKVVVSGESVSTLRIKLDQLMKGLWLYVIRGD